MENFKITKMFREEINIIRKSAEKLCPLIREWNEELMGNKEDVKNTWKEYSTIYILKQRGT